MSVDIEARDLTAREELSRYRQQQEISPATPRRDAVILRILDMVASEPVLTIETVTARHTVSPAAAHRALVQRADAGVLGRNTDQKGRLICWSADRKANRAIAAFVPYGVPYRHGIADLGQWMVRPQICRAGRAAFGHFRWDCLNADAAVRNRGTSGMC
ncbi:hypothetical protein [Cryobacterium sp. MLB-32]|uniref:hypothetical protein n=1 Tax=Cryobacterium sp. MLB-32 TaxID=1529318 RepID=UPI0012DFFB54|nr:hypothetical protein [Cryobacterium sp. MLB-32]